MKMSRDQLKALVKQCLLELLSEGLGASLDQQALPVPVPFRGVAESRNKKPRFDPSLDTPVRRSTPSPLTEAIKRHAGGNPVMESIFADTARTTLSEMMRHGDSSAEGTSSASVNQQEQFNGTPEDVFGEEAAGKWASLAFAGSPKKTA